MVTDGRGDGGLNGKGGVARRKEWHGKERRHDGRPRQRTAEHWAAGKRLWAGREGEARVAAVDYDFSGFLDGFFGFSRPPPLFCVLDFLFGIFRDFCNQQSQSAK